MHHADGDDAHAEIARLLAEIARRHGRTVAVERQGLVKRECRRGTDNRRRAVTAGSAPRPPRVRPRAYDVECRDGLVIEILELRIRGRVLEALGLDEVQQQDGVVIREAPEWIVEIAKHGPRLSVPAPPQVVGELVQAADSHGQRRKRHVAIH